MSEILVNKLTGTSTAGNITVTDGSVTFKMQDSLTKHWVNYDAPDQTTDGSLNQSSLTDHSAGEFSSTFTNNFSSATNKCHLSSCLNSSNGGDNRTSDVGRAGMISNLGHAVSDSTSNPLSTSEIQFYTTYGSSGANDAAVYDVSGTYCTSIGDLA